MINFIICKFRKTEKQKNKARTYIFYKKHSWPYIHTPKNTLYVAGQLRKIHGAIYIANVKINNYSEQFIAAQKILILQADAC